MDNEPDMDFEEEEASPEKMAKLHMMVDRLDAMELECEQMEEKLKEKQKEARTLRENDIPDYMLSIGVKSIETQSGLKVELKEEVRVSFFAKNPEKRGPAFEWLKAHGHDGLVKNVVSVQFGKDQEQVAEKFVAYAKQFERPIDVAQKQDIHSSTLKSFLTEQLELGTGVPLELFGAMQQKFARIKRPKSKD